MIFKSGSSWSADEVGGVVEAGAELGDELELLLVIVLLLNGTLDEEGRAEEERGGVGEADAGGSGELDNRDIGPM